MSPKRPTVPLSALAAAALVAGSVPGRPARAAVPHPHRYRIGPSGVPGWAVTAIGANRRESDWRAWKDSRPQSYYFYGGSWRALGRVAGWFERLSLARGAAEAQAVVLVSEFSTIADAQRAYRAILPHAAALAPLPGGTQAAEWQTNAGVASGRQGLAGYFGGFTTFMQAGPIVVEVRADVVGRQGQILRPPLPNPGRAIARHLARIAEATLS